MNSRFFIGLLLGVAITSIVVIFVNYHKMFATEKINQLEQGYKQQYSSNKKSNTDVIILAPSVKMHQSQTTNSNESTTNNANNLDPQAMNPASTPHNNLKEQNQQIIISIAKYDNLKEADAMVGKLSLLGFNPIIKQNQQKYEVILFANNQKEQKELEHNLQDNNINFGGKDVQ